MSGYSKLHRSLDSDDDFNTLSINAQHLYLRLLAAPSMTYAGVCDWRPPRMLHKWAGASVADIQDAAEELRHARFAFADNETEEILIRTAIRHDGLMKQRNMAVAMMRAFDGISSPSLRRICLWEIHRLHEDEPKFSGWEKVGRLLKMEAIDPSIDPKVDPSVYPKVDPSIEYQPKGSVDPSVGIAATTPSTIHTSPHTRQKTSTDKSAVPEGFEKFWDAYGKKLKRADGIRAYRTALKKPGITPDFLAQAATEFIAWQRSEGIDPQYDPYPSAWLRGERWADERVARQARQGARNQLPAAPPLQHASGAVEPPDHLSTREEVNAWYAEQSKASRSKGTQP